MRRVILFIASCIVRGVPFGVQNGSFVHLIFSYARLQARAGYYSNVLLPYERCTLSSPSRRNVAWFLSGLIIVRLPFSNIPVISV